VYCPFIDVPILAAFQKMPRTLVSEEKKKERNKEYVSVSIASQSFLVFKSTGETVVVVLMKIYRHIAYPVLLRSRRLVWDWT
jgi:hypothetical protein